MIRITKKDFSVEKIIKKIKKPKVGAVVTFLGTVRSFSGNKEVKKLKYETYREMALKKMNELRKKILKKFKVDNITIIHRVNSLKPKENVVLIAVSAEHRKSAFQACEYAINKIKEEVPIWKKEFFK